MFFCPTKVLLMGFAILIAHCDMVKLHLSKSHTMFEKGIDFLVFETETCFVECIGNSRHNWKEKRLFMGSSQNVPMGPRKS